MKIHLRDMLVITKVAATYLAGAGDSFEVLLRYVSPLPFLAAMWLTPPLLMLAFVLFLLSAVPTLYSKAIERASYRVLSLAFGLGYPCSLVITHGIIKGAQPSNAVEAGLFVLPIVLFYVVYWVRFFRVVSARRRAAKEACSV